MSEINDYLKEIDQINRKRNVNINLKVIEIRKKYLENKKKLKQQQKEERLNKELNKKQGINPLAQPFVPRNLKFGDCKSQPANLALYNRIKSSVKRKVKRWPSAYASGQLVRRYKSSGGKYSCSRFGKLDDWFAQKWVDVCTGRPCGRKTGEKRKYPYCRPTRTSGKTPRKMSQLTPTQIKQRCKRKHLIKGKRLNNFGKGSKDPMFLNLKNTKSILQIRKNIINRCQGQPWDKIWTYIISQPVTDITKIKYVLKTKKYNVNKTPSKVYEKYIKKGTCSSFYSPGGTLLVIPNKPYINITDFAQNSTQKEWISLWHEVAKQTKKMKKPFYISTHGHGVNWLHVRLENKLMRILQKQCTSSHEVRTLQRFGSAKTCTSNG